MADPESRILSFIDVFLLLLEEHNRLQDIKKYESQEKARQDFFTAYLKPQWGWKSFASIAVTTLIVVLITIHLEINIIEAIGNTIKYIADLLKFIDEASSKYFVGQVISEIS